MNGFGKEEKASWTQALREIRKQIYAYDMPEEDRIYEYMKMYHPENWEYTESAWRTLERMFGDADIVRAVYEKIKIELEGVPVEDDPSDFELDDEDKLIKYGLEFERIGDRSYAIRPVEGNFVDDDGEEYYVHVHDDGERWVSSAVYDEETNPADMPVYIEICKRIEEHHGGAEDAPDICTAVFLSGYAIYGAGKNAEEAIEDAREWVADFEGMKREIEEGNPSNEGKFELIRISKAVLLEVKSMGGEIPIEKDEAGVYRLPEEGDE